jgi:hypothetical protein
VNLFLIAGIFMRNLVYELIPIISALMLLSNGSALANGCQGEQNGTRCTVNNDSGACIKSQCYYNYNQCSGSSTPCSYVVNGQYKKGTCDAWGHCG